MKKFFLVSILMGVLPLSMVAQDDDLYFVPKKKSAKTITSRMPKEAYYSGSNRSVDEYNRRPSTYEVIGNDTINDIIEFSGVQGVYPDSIESEDFALTKKMERFEDYNLSANAAFWAGYNAGLNDWGWHSPWYFSRYYYDPWYYKNWYGWYDPYYLGYYANWYYPWYSWYGGWYGWAAPYYYGYGYPYYSYYIGVGSGRLYSHTGNAGTINLRGGSRVMSSTSGVARASDRGRLSGRAAERSSSLRERTVNASRVSSTSVNRTSVNTRSVTNNNSNFNGGSRMSSGSSYSSGGGSSFSSGGGASRGGGSVGGGGGGGPRGGRR